MKIETSPVIELDKLIALRSKSYSFSYNQTQKSKQKGIQKSPTMENYITSLFNNKTTNSTNYSIRSNCHNLTVEKQNKLALNPFDDKRLYLNPIQSLPWDKHIQKGDCTCILCIKFIALYYNELSKNKTDEEKYWSIWYYKENLTQQQLIELISARAHPL